MSITFHWSNENESKSVKLDNMLAFLNEKIYSEDMNTFPTLCKNGPYNVLSAEIGRKYIRIISTSGGSRSAYCFIDMKGNILMAASWKAPAKHSRGSVFDVDYSWGKALGRYGAAYLR